MTQPFRLFAGPIETGGFRADNVGMEVSGTVHNGVVVLQEGVDLPDGVRVRVVVQADDQPDKTNCRVVLPIVPSRSPGSVSLSHQKIAEILDDEDLARH